MLPDALRTELAAVSDLRLLTQPTVPLQTHQTRRISCEGPQTVVIPGGELSQRQTHGHQCQGIKLSARILGVLNVVTTDSHRNTRALQLTDRRQRPAQRGFVVAMTEQPAIGER